MASSSCEWDKKEEVLTGERLQQRDRERLNSGKKKGFLMNGAAARNEWNEDPTRKGGSRWPGRRMDQWCLCVVALFSLIPFILSCPQKVRATDTLPGIASPGSGSLAPFSVPSPEKESLPFRHGKRLTILPGDPQRSVLAYVARRLFPFPDFRLKGSIAAAIDRLDREVAFSFRTEKATWRGRPALLVTVGRYTLNRMADRLQREVRTHPVFQKIRHITLVGVPARDRSFVLSNLGVNPGNPAANEPLSDNLYALSQVPGFSRVDGLFLPQPVSGGSDLVVKETPAAPLSGSQIEMDNYGYSAVGQLTINGTLFLSDTLLAGDQFTVSASTAPFGTIFFGMNAGTLSYSAPITLKNRLGLDLNAMDYKLGGGWSPWGHGSTTAQLVALGLSGSNYGMDGWGSHAFVRSSTATLSLKGTVFLKEFQDTYSPSVQNDRSLVGGTLDLSAEKTAGRVSASVDIADSEYGLTQGSGSSFQNPFYASTPGLQNYLTGNGGIWLTMTSVYSVSLSTVDLQYFGGGVLDPMLQGVLGGMSNVRSLPTAALFGNDLYTGSLAFLRTDAVRGGSLVSTLFFDAGQVIGIGTDYSAMGPGVEESWTGEHFFGKADLAVPVGALPIEALGNQIVALTGGNIQNGGLPIQLWLSVGWRY